MNTDETINKEELTLQNTPKAVNYLINEIAEMRVLLEHIESQLHTESAGTCNKDCCIIIPPHNIELNKVSKYSNQNDL